MSITQQHALDLYRAARLGDPPPPQPGRQSGWRLLLDACRARDRATPESAPERRTRSKNLVGK